MINYSLSIVIPVYNSEKTLPLLLERLNQVIPDLTNDFEVILVNDGSSDKSWELILSLAERYPFVRGFNMMRNYGQHNALLCGTRAAQKEIIVTMDDDLQHPPEEIYKFFPMLDQGFDVVYGSPRKMPHSLFRNLASRVTKKTLAFVMGIKTVREISAFRAFRTRLRQAFDAYQSPGVILDVLLSWGTNRFSSVTVEENPREVGKSNYNFSRLFKQVFLILTGYSTTPLRLASVIGFGATLFGLAILLYVVYIYFFLGSVPGFPFLASIISLFGGTQLFAVGIIGEYLARVFDRSTDRPPYVVGATTQDSRL